MERRILQEAQRLELTLQDGRQVNSFDLLREYFASMEGMDAMENMYSCGIGVWEGSMGWNEDASEQILEDMGWEYDEVTTTDKGKNNLANGVVMKVISRIRTNTRRRLRLCCKNGKSGYDLCVRRKQEEVFDGDGKRTRRKPGFQFVDLTQCDDSDSGSGNETPVTKPTKKVSCKKGNKKLVHISKSVFVFSLLRVIRALQLWKRKIDDCDLSLLP